jgi:CxxC motif-containing protein (DUF1111 family)
VSAKFFHPRESVKIKIARSAVLFSLFVFFATVIVADFGARDPGVRAGSIDAGQHLYSVPQTSGAYNFFTDGLDRFQEIDDVAGGLGPRFNTNQCSSCHSQPAIGGTSPSATVFPFVGPNPETQVFNLDGAQNTLPSFITADGPVREARFKFFLNSSGGLTNNLDGGVHALFVISGRSDAGSCSIKQPDFAHNLALNNVSFRIPTPTFGAGLIENISEETIWDNMHANGFIKQSFGISGHPNRDGNDGMIARFGWKAQNKSLEIFSGEAYNVEMGVTNEVFQNERSNPEEALRGGLPAACKLNPTPEDMTRMAASQDSGTPGDAAQFAMFMRLLAPPTASTTSPGGPNSIANGRQVFSGIGCALCHTPALQTAPSHITPALNKVSANLFSDLLVHNMGSNLADGVSQGGAGPDEFRTAPLWGLGQRIFFLHDGRTSDLVNAIQQHASSGSEANAVIRNFNNLSPQQKQNLLNFLRSL